MQMSQGSRRHHSKTRNGCGQCKKRRVRCNLEPPVCSNCRRRGEVCDYSTGDVAFLGHFGSDTSQLFTSKSAPVIYDCAWVQKKDTGRIVLGRPTAVAPSLSTSKVAAQCMISWALDKVWLQPLVSVEEEMVWRTTLERQAARYSYLDRSASSLWILYMSLGSESSSSSSLRADAYRRNVEASALFRQANPIVTDQNWFAVLSFGVVVVIFRFAVAQISAGNAQDHIEIFQVLRSTSGMAAVVTPYFRRSQLWPFVDIRQGIYQPTLDRELWKEVGALDAIDLAGEAWEDAEACRQAIAQLKAWIQETDGHPRSWAHFFRWPGLVSDHFTTLLSANNQQALIIFVYWCAVMHLSPKRWFMDGWASRSAFLAMKAMNRLDDHLLRWPRKILTANIPADIILSM